MTYQELLARLKLANTNVSNAYPYGSRVYGTHNQQSDYDFILVLKNKKATEYSDNQVNVFYYTEDEFRTRLVDHEISALECIFLPEHLKLKEEVTFPHRLDLSQLYTSLSAKSGNSWEKCRKKLTIPESLDLQVGRKSLFHAFRILTFGKQIALNGQITNYQEANPILQEVMAHYYAWEQVFESFESRYHALCAEFQQLTQH